MQIPADDGSPTLLPAQPEAEAAVPLKPEIVVDSTKPARAKRRKRASDASTNQKEYPLFNREYSWLEFNARVLGEARNPAVPLLERLKFLSIVASNFDEFAMVRVGGIRDLLTAGISDRSPDGLTPRQQLGGIRERSKKHLKEMYECLNKEILPALKEVGISIEYPMELSKKERIRLAEYFRKELEPILTPLAIDPGHPFPFLANQALTLAITLESSRGDEHLVFVKLPTMLPRLIALSKKHGYVPLEALITEHVGHLFPGLVTRRITPFRVIRNADYVIREDEVEHDLLQSVESELRRRERKQVVWIEIAGEADPTLVTLLTSATGCAEEDVFFVPSLLRPSDLMQIYGDVHKSSYKDPPFNPRIPPQLATQEDIFSIIRKGDILLHRPYDSFAAVVEFVQAAAEDPDVVAIKQTIYRSDPDAPIVEALAQAAQKGKQVAVVIELQARFDEMKNITWARQLEEAGVQVVYGLVGIKTHCKLCLVVRRENNQLRRYVHLSTGNYNAATGRLYTDIDLFTTDDDFGNDSTQLTNILTGYSVGSVQDIFEGSADLKWKRMIVAPIDYHKWSIRMIEREIAHAKQGKKARIIAKLNAIVEKTVIEALYRASQAGVKIDLVVRGICCLVPGVPGLSENIRVISIVDRFLEHVRIFYFRNDGEYEVFISSGDWMPRNLFKRIELIYPVIAQPLKERLVDQILDISLRDTIKAWELRPDGSYHRLTPDADKIRSQEKFIEIARAEAVRLAPYEETIKKPGKSRRKAKQQKKKGKKGKAHD